MYFKIDYEKVSNIGNHFKNKSEELDILYDDVLGLCDQISSNYKSIDSDIYVEKFRNYIKLLKIENEDLRNGGLVLNEISSICENQEGAWEKKIDQLDKEKRRN